MTRGCLVLVLAAGVTLGLGCGSDETSVPDTGQTADLGGADGQKPDGGSRSDGGGVTVEVIYAGGSHTVDLSQPGPVTLDGTPYARLSDVVLLALPGQTLASLTADFEASDGFKPSEKANCTGLTPLDGDKLAKGYVHPTSRNMRWDDDLGFPGCMAVNGLGKIIIADK